LRDRLPSWQRFRRERGPTVGFALEKYKARLPAASDASVELDTATAGWYTPQPDDGSTQNRPTVQEKRMRFITKDRTADVGWCLACVAVVAALVCCGVPTNAAPISNPPPAKRQPLDSSLVPPLGSWGGDHVFAIHVGELFDQPNMADVAREINDFLATKLKPAGFPCNFPIRVQDIDQVAGRIMWQIVGKEPPRGSLTLSLTAVRLKTPRDWAKTIHAELPKVKEINHEGEVYYEANWQPPPGTPLPPVLQLYTPDDRTIILESGPTITKLIEAKKKPPARPAWAPQWQEVEGGLLAIALSDPKHASAKLLGGIPPTLGVSEDERHQSEMIEKVNRLASHLVVGLDTHGGFRIRAVVICDSATDAKELEKTCIEMKKMASPLPDAATASTDDSKAAIALHRALSAGLVIERKGKQVIVTAESKKHGSEALIVLLKEISGSGPTQPPAAPPPRRERPWFPAGTPSPGTPFTGPGR
jgi:hypothetical protein